LKSNVPGVLPLPAAIVKSPVAATLAVPQLLGLPTLSQAMFTVALYPFSAVMLPLNCACCPT
jgi:hypothetical protein